ncbi:hypothetical protein KL86PLE_40052 [uncultured Pleomorphomonas sp.]|uniref:Uncharacterized protein n=1 Tax=uncultured Pleomorphomonas sp. TaxID=442121 RepID=A0A212LFK3_9HYPH|nr:hypothetical protein KL86PLE_40052 [uncultured Pleomorphomonas sp.]
MGRAREPVPGHRRQGRRRGDHHRQGAVPGRHEAALRRVPDRSGAQGPAAAHRRLQVRTVAGRRYPRRPATDSYGQNRPGGARRPDGFPAGLPPLPIVIACTPVAAARRRPDRLKEINGWLRTCRPRRAD